MADECGARGTDKAKQKSTNLILKEVRASEVFQNLESLESLESYNISKVFLLYFC